MNEEQKVKAVALDFHFVGGGVFGVILKPEDADWIKEKWEDYLNGMGGGTVLRDPAGKWLINSGEVGAIDTNECECSSEAFGEREEEDERGTAHGHEAELRLRTAEDARIHQRGQEGGSTSRCD